MGYCFQCGVEISEDNTHCPLCGALLSQDNESEPVLDPVHDEITLHERVEYNRPLFMAAVSALFAVSMVITLFVDFAFHRQITWSFYAMISIVALWALLVFPILYKGRSIILPLIFQLLIISIYVLILDNHTGTIGWSLYPALSLIGVSALLSVILARRVLGLLTPLILSLADVLIFLFLLDLLSTGTITWFLPLGLPLGLLGWSDLVIIVYAVRYKIRRVSASKAVWFALVLVLILSALTLIVINIIVSLHIHSRILIDWSIITTLSLIPGIAFTLIVYLRDDLQNLILKKLHI
jgi:hypothetical protein